jgi:hypothetical protein
MHLVALGLGATIALAAVPAPADIRIASDGGGKIGDYFARYQHIRRSGERVIIDGPCLSACTLVVAIIPRDRLCATRNAVLGFHGAWTVESAGRSTTSLPASRALLKLYPPAVRAWVTRRGGLTAHMLLMRGRELEAVVPPCEGGDGPGAPR